MPTRRDFLRALGAMGLGASLAGTRIFTPPFASAQDDDFVMMQAGCQADIPGLEALLETPPIVPLKNKVDVQVERYPGIAYHCSFKADEESVDVVSAQLISAGSIFVLGNDGHFISARHVFDDCIKAQGNGDTNNIMICYEPSLQRAMEATPLLYSQKYDMLLGKINIPNGVQVKKTLIATEEEPPLGCVYTTKYANMTYVLDELFTKVIGAGMCDWIETSRGISRIRYQQERPVQGSLKDLEVEIEFGHLADVVNPEDGTSYYNDRKGVFRFITSIHHGNSGSPVFDLHNRFMGVIFAKADHVKDAKSGKSYNLAVYVGPQQIRRMIRAYLDYCR